MSPARVQTQEQPDALVPHAVAGQLWPGPERPLSGPEAEHEQEHDRGEQDDPERPEWPAPAG